MVLADFIELERVRLDLSSVNPLVGRCRFTVSKPALKAPTVSALETRKA
jgi:hypothetical protein